MTRRARQALWYRIQRLARPFIPKGTRTPWSGPVVIRVHGDTGRIERALRRVDRRGPGPGASR